MAGLQRPPKSLCFGWRCKSALLDFGESRVQDTGVRQGASLLPLCHLKLQKESSALPRCMAGEDWHRSWARPGRSWLLFSYQI